MRSTIHSSAAYTQPVGTKAFYTQALTLPAMWKYNESECMERFLSALSNIPRLDIPAVIDILVVAILIYQFFLIVRGRRVAHILTGLGFLTVVYLVAKSAQLELLRTILSTLAPYTAIALIVMFQSELRRVLARLGRRPFLGVSELERREVAEEILLAVAQLAQKHIGALIVVERKIGLRTFTESGIRLDAAISRDLLCSIFQPLGALHDGAVIVQGDRVAAAACFLPLTTNPSLLNELGTRHRAAIGISEESDCISIVVSEETGRISLAAFGDIELSASLYRIEQALTGRLQRDESRQPAVTSIEPPAGVRDTSLNQS
jgi:diadenylate cyclase